MRSQLTLLAAAMALAACGPQGPENDAGAPAAQAPAPEPAAATAPIAMAAADYVAGAAAGDLYEIESSKVALQSSQNPDVRAFAEMMVADHTKASADLKTAVAQSGQSLAAPAVTPADKQALLDALNGATSAGFDALYLTQQVQAHEQALKLHQAYAQSGDVASLKAFASAMAPVVQRHLDQVRQLHDRLAASPDVVQPDGATAAAPADKAAASPPAKAAATAPATPAPKAPAPKQ